MENNDYNNAGYSLINCFPNCKYNFYFNDNYDYICLNKSGCLPNMKYLIDGQKQCIKTCKGTKYIYEFRQKCFQSCPEESIPFSNKTVRPVESRDKTTVSGIRLLQESGKVQG